MNFSKYRNLFFHCSALFALIVGGYLVVLLNVPLVHISATEKIEHLSFFSLHVQMKEGNIPRLIRSEIYREKQIRFSEYAILFTYKGSPNAQNVSVAGNMTNWAARRMQRNEQNVFFLQIPLAELAGKYRGKKFLVLNYKYLVDGIWISDPTNLVKKNDQNGVRISSIEIDIQNSPLVYASAQISNSHLQEVVFQVYLPQATTVRVLGDFNAWDSQAHPMYKLHSKLSNGYFYTQIRLPKGRHTYLYLVDGKNLIKDPFNPQTQYNNVLGMRCSELQIQ